jgi:Na+-transporting methylmalonyl-CoA/oxaloacetate decarboxylase gamma subunit
MLLAQQDERPMIDFTLAPLREEIGIPLAVMGILVVFSALVLVVVFITLLPRVLGLFSSNKLEAETTVPAFDEDDLPEETVVVIAAAVAATISRPHRIVQIRGLTPAERGWSLEGRTQHHQSHRIQPRAR